jgi:CMP/dCMP kinase
MKRPDGILIAIDGPAGSGKSSTARAVVAEMGYRHLDSGAFYRAITRAALEARIPVEEWSGLTVGDLERLRVAGVPGSDGFRMMIGDRDVSQEIRAPDVNAEVSRMAAVGAVRGWLLGALRRVGEQGGLVADGRDIGTVVFPDAELKVFLVAAPEERARRRLLEQGVPNPGRDEIREEAARLKDRDLRDSTRAVAPLLRAPDAILLDTSGLDFQTQVRAIVRLARAAARA